MYIFSWPQFLYRGVDLLVNRAGQNSVKVDLKSKKGQYNHGHLGVYFYVAMVCTMLGPLLIPYRATVALGN